MRELGLKRFLHTSKNLINILLKSSLKTASMQLPGSLLDYGLENVLTVKENKDFKMAPLSILTKWLAAGQRAHDSRSMFPTHTGNVTYSFYLT